MNLELRTEILKHSLELEDALNKILIRLIKVKSEEPKTLGHKSSAISFSAKVNLLYDRDNISKDEYNLLFCFMEIRNQFMHNLDADSFDRVIDRIGKKGLFLDSNKEFKNRLITETDSSKKEEIYKIIYGAFYRKLLKLILDQYENLIESDKQERIRKVKLESSEMTEDMFKMLGESIDKSAEILGKSMDETFERETEIGENFKRGVNRIFHKKMMDKYPELFEKENKNDH